MGKELSKRFSAALRPHIYRNIRQMIFIDTEEWDFSHLETLLDHIPDE